MPTLAELFKKRAAEAGVSVPKSAISPFTGKAAVGEEAERFKPLALPSSTTPSATQPATPRDAFVDQSAKSYPMTPMNQEPTPRVSSATVSAPPVEPLPPQAPPKSAATLQLEQEARNMAQYGTPTGIAPSAAPVPTPTAAPVSPTAPAAPVDDPYRRAYADYISSLSSSQDVEDARKKYLDFVQQRDTAMTDIEGRTQPMRFITGQQAQLAKMAEIQQARLQGDVGLAQERQAGQQAAARARLDYEDTLAQRELARQQAEAEAGQPMTLSPGQTVYDPRTGQALFTAPTEGKSVTLSPGQKVYDSQGRLIASNDSTTDKLTTLGKDQILVDAQGNIIARGESATGEIDPATSNLVRAATTVVRDVTDALSLMEGSPAFANDAKGFLAANRRLIASKIAGTAEWEIAKLVQSVKDNIGIDTLLNIKREGSGLGQVPQSQLETLQGVLGRLEVARDPNLLKRDLNDALKMYQDIIDKAMSESRTGAGDALDSALDQVGFNRVGGDTNGAASGYQVSGYGSDYWKHGLDVVVGNKGSSVSLPISGTVVDVVSGFSNPSGKPLSYATGKSQNKGFGNQVKIRLPDGREVWVSHLDSVSVRKGQQVKAGQALGTQGNTGLTYGKTGVHVDITAKKPDGSYYTPQEVERLFLSRA